MTEYIAPGNIQRLDELHSDIFYLSVWHAESLRNFRSAAKNNTGIFACENIIIQPPRSLSDTDGNELLGWPHWILKCLYSDVGLMFGKFWIGEEDTSREGTAIPKPPCHFISIRSAIKDSDPYFLSATPKIGQEIINSCDDGSNVHKKITQMLPEMPSIHEMREANYYSIAREWAQNELDLITTA